MQNHLKVAQASQLLPRLEQLQEELRQAQAQVESLNAKLLQAEAGQVFQDVQSVGDDRDRKSVV